MARLNPIEPSPVRGRAQSEGELSTSDSESIETIPPYRPDVSTIQMKHIAAERKMDTVAKPGGVLGFFKRGMSFIGGSSSIQKHAQVTNEDFGTASTENKAVEHEDVKPEIEEAGQPIPTSGPEDLVLADAAEAEDEDVSIMEGEAIGEASDLYQEALGAAEKHSTPSISRGVTSVGKPLLKSPITKSVKIDLFPKKSLKHPTYAPGVIKGGKGLSTVDLYEPPTYQHSLGGDGGGGRAKKLDGDRPAKRQKTVMAKARLVMPKAATLRGKGKARAGPRQPSPSAGPEFSMVARPISQSPGGNHGSGSDKTSKSIEIDAEIQPIPAPKKRGRPRKIRQTEEASAVQHPIAEQVEDTSHQEPQQPETLGAPEAGGVSEILMNMSPVKPAFPCAASRPIQRPVERAEDGLFVQRPTQEGVEEDESEPEDEENSLDSLPRLTSSLSFSGVNLVDIPFLTQMRMAIYQVGHRNGPDGLEKIRDTQAYTPTGQELSGNIEKLRSTYSLLRSAREQRNKTRIQKYQEKAKIFTEAINASVSEHTDRAISKRLLKDLYFSIIPRLTRCVECCGEAYVVEGSMETPDLQEFSVLVKLLEQLARFATGQDGEIQPRANSNASYKVSQPTRSLLPLVRKLHMRLAKELEERERAERLAEQERMRPERERQYEEKRCQEEAERERKRELNRREQSLAFQRQLNDPILGPQIARALWPAGGPIPPQLSLYAKKLSAQRVVAQRPGSQESSVEDDPFAVDLDENREVRVKVFGKNNTSKNSQVRKITKEERKEFMLTLKRERGPDRYQITAQKLELTLEEVFNYAKDLQEMMDRKHQNGEYEASEGYWWTYEIWVEKR